MIGKFLLRPIDDDDCVLIGYELEYFSFLFIAVLFSAGNAKKNIFTVFTVPIVTIGGIEPVLECGG